MLTNRFSALLAAHASRTQDQRSASPSPKRESSDPRYTISYYVVAVSVLLLLMAVVTAALI